MDVILVSSRAPDNNANKHEGLNIIRQSLLENGIKTYLKHISKFDPTKLKKDSIVGFSSYYESLNEVIAKADATKKSGNHFVVIGGPGTYHKGTNKKLLDTGAFDALNMGHAAPFVEMIKYIHHNNPTNEPLERIALMKGLATKNYQIFEEGEFPALEKYPIKSYPRRGKVAISIPPMRNCPNKCDYCIESRSRVPDLTDKIIKSLIEYQKSEKIKVISFSSPTFNKPNINDAKKILSVVEGKPETVFYADSHEITMNPNGILKQLDEFNTTSLYIGLNAIDNRSAKYMGRKIGNKVRTDIDSEKAAIIKFLNAERDVTSKEDYTISILVTKAENRNSYLRLIRFADELVEISLKKDKKIAFQIMQTIPYPGTAFAHNHAKDYQFVSRKNFFEDINTTKCSYNKKSTEFLRRSYFGSYHLACADDPVESLVGLNSILWAYELTYEGEMKTLLSKNKNYVKCMEGEKDFILNPEILFKHKPEDSNLK